MTVTVIVDDSDSGIQYNPPDLSNDTPPPDIVTDTTLLNSAIGNTLRNFSSSGLSFAYNFTGSYIGIYAVLPAGPSLSVPYPWDCELDNNPTPPVVIQARTEASITKICAQSGLNKTVNHTITFYSFGFRRFDILFDFIEYLPIPSNTSQMYPYVSVTADDPSVQFIGELDNFSSDDGTYLASLDGFNSSLSYQFNGSAIIALGGILNSFGTGNYTIDSQPYSTFNITQKVDGSIDGSQPGRILFNASDLNPAQNHEITIPGPFGTDDDPWGLHSFVIVNGTISSSNVFSTTIPPSASTSSGATNHTSGSSTPKLSRTYIVVFVIVASVVFIMIPAGLIWRRFRHRRKHAEIQHSLTQLSQYTPFPFSQAVLSESVSVDDKIWRQSSRRDEEGSDISNTLIFTPILEQSNTQQANGDADALGSRHGVTQIQEQDSGVRGVKGTGKKDSNVVIVPPAYSAV